jgi:hypothetical protein
MQGTEVMPELTASGLKTIGINTTSTKSQNLTIDTAQNSRIASLQFEFCLI